MPVKIRGAAEVSRKLAALGDRAKPLVKVAIESAGKLIENQTKDNITARNLILSGTFRRSITTEVEDSRGSLTAFVGPDHVPYGPRLELGFSGRDSLGRTYNQPPRPTLRPALIQQKDNVRRELLEALRILVRQAGR